MKKLFVFGFVLLLWIPVLAEPVDSVKVKKKPGFTGIPNLSFDRSRGMGFGANLMLMVHLDPKHPGTPASQFSLMGEYTTKKDWMAFTFSRLFLKDDRYRLAFGGGYFNSNFQTYKNFGDEQIEIPYNTYGTILFAAPSVRIYDKFYLGISGQYFKSHLVFEDPAFSEGNSNSYQNALGASLLYDSKDDQSFPSRGLLTAFIYKTFPSWLSNDSTFNKVNLFANYYHPLRSNMVLASRISLNMALGDNVPFVSQSYVGNKDIRGYTKGEYRGDQTYAAQSELRWNFYKKWGAVGFFGLALAHSPGETSPLLPGGGIGVRYRVLPKYKMNIGIDAALGKDDWGIYFRIGEAF